MQKDNSELRDRLRSQLKSYLSAMGLRHTTCRFAVLDKCVEMSEHFDINDLYSAVQAEYSISRASVYKTVELLCECNILRKHYLRENQADYEIVGGRHLHLICMRCGAVGVQDVSEMKEFEGIQLAGRMAGVKYKSFYPAYVVANIYGLCASCYEQLSADDNPGFSRGLYALIDDSRHPESTLNQ